MQIVIRIDGKDWSSLTDEEKDRYRIQLNDQALKAAGYERDKK